MELGTLPEVVLMKAGQFGNVSSQVTEGTLTVLTCYWAVIAVDPGYNQGLVVELGILLVPLEKPLNFPAAETVVQVSGPSLAVPEELFQKLYFLVGSLVTLKMPVRSARAVDLGLQSAERDALLETVHRVEVAASLEAGTAIVVEGLIEAEVLWVAVVAVIVVGSQE